MYLLPREIQELLAFSRLSIQVNVVAKHLHKLFLEIIIQVNIELIMAFHLTIQRCIPWLYWDSNPLSMELGFLPCGERSLSKSFCGRSVIYLNLQN